MSRMAGAATALMILSLVSTPAQTPTNFSGRWILEPDAPPAGGRGGRGGPGTMGSGWGTDITITQDPAAMTVEYAQYGRGEMQPLMKFVYLLNGAESRNTINIGRGPQDQVSTAKWDGATLRLTTVHSFKSPQTGEPVSTEITQALTLESGGALVIETTRRGTLGGKPSTIKTRYKKS